MIGDTNSTVATTVASNIPVTFDMASVGVGVSRTAYVPSNNYYVYPDGAYVPTVWYWQWQPATYPAVTYVYPGKADLSDADVERIADAVAARMKRRAVKRSPARRTTR